MAESFDTDDSSPDSSGNDINEDRRGGSRVVPGLRNSEVDEMVRIINDGDGDAWKQFRSETGTNLKWREYYQIPKKSMVSSKNGTKSQVSSRS